MTKICPNCEKNNLDTAKFCDDCGTTLNTTTTEKPKKTSGIMKWWNKQGKGAKIGSIIGICCLGLLIIGLITSMGSPDQTTSSSVNTTTSTTSSAPTSAPAAETPKVVTVSQLYGSSIAEGTLVKVTGTVLQSDGYSLRIENSEGQDILIEGTDLNAYEDKKVTVIGTFEGPTSYTTAMGSSRTVPTIKDAKIA